MIAGKAGYREKVLSEKPRENLIIIRVYFPEIPPRWLLYSLPASYYLKALLHRGKAKLIISNSPQAYLTLRGFKKEKFPVISVNHGSPYSILSFYNHVRWEDLEEVSPVELGYYFEAPLIKWLAKKELVISDRCVFVANHVLAEFKSLYMDLAKEIQFKSSVIYPGIEYDDLVKLRRSLEKIDSGKIVVAYIGRLYYTKGVTHAVKAIEYLVNEGYRRDVELWIFGKGPLELWLKHYIKRRGLQAYIRYFEFIERARLLALLAKYVDVVLHPSLYEGAPMAVIESQALGIPVVAYDLPWAQEFIANGVNGYRVPYADIPALAKHILKALDLDRDRISLQARKFNKERFLKELEEVLINLALTIES